MNLTQFTSRGWKDITKWEWDYLRHKGICNGCGGAGDKIPQKVFRWILKTILKRLRLIFIQASCDIHDFTYWQGGDEKRRKECDMGFFQVIIGDIQKAELGAMTVLKYTFLALSFYYAVRIGGRYYFNYR